MFRPSTSTTTDQLWNIQKKRMLNQFSKLNDEDFDFETGRKYEMIKNIGVKLGKTETEIKRIFQEI